MEIDIIAFGIAKDIIGQQKIAVEVEESYTVNQLKDWLLKNYPKFIEVQSIKIAVNEVYAKDDLILQAKDEIVIIPPVSGG